MLKKLTAAYTPAPLGLLLFQVDEIMLNPAYEAGARVHR